MMKTNILYLSILMICLYIQQGFSLEDNTISDMSVKRDSKGTVISIAVKKTLIVTSRHKTEQGKSTFEIILGNTKHNLESTMFGDFPKKSPVEKIVLSELTKRLSVKFYFKKKYADDITCKVKGEYVFIFVTPKGGSEYYWKASYMKEIAKKNGPASISNINLFMTGAVEYLTILTDKNSFGECSIFQDSAVLFFPNSVSSLFEKSFTPPEASLFQKITMVKKDNKDEKSSIAITVHFSKNSRIIGERKNDRIILYGASRNGYKSKRLMRWSATSGAQFVYDPQENREKVLKKRGNIFIKDEDIKARYIVLRNNINLRSSSRITKKNVIGKLRLGEVGTRLQKKGKWVKIRFETMKKEGWVYKSLVKDSVRVSKRRFTNLRKEYDRIVQREIKKQKIKEKREKKTGNLAYAGGRNNSKLDKRQVRYKRFGRDPFLPLDNNGIEVSQSELPNIKTCQLVGILYDSGNKVALFEDTSKDNEPLTLSEKSRVLNGRVLKIKPDRVIFAINEGGFYQRHVVKLNVSR